MGKQKHIFVTDSEHILYSIEPHPNLAEYCHLSGTVTNYKPIATLKIYI